jgi:hypothetical protein
LNFEINLPAVKTVHFNELMRTNITKAFSIFFQSSRCSGDSFQKRCEAELNENQIKLIVFEIQESYGLLVIAC